MGYECKVIADSVSEIGCRLTTLQLRFPRFILAEFNTHRMLSRNAQSSRAIPIKRRIQQVETDPFVPEAFGRNQRGMQAGEELDQETTLRACVEWMAARNAAVMSATRLTQLGVHKQLANRLLEPFCWVDVVVTATEWDNFFHLRTHKDAQPEFQKIAKLMECAIGESVPRRPTEVRDLRGGTSNWHLPYVWDDPEVWKSNFAHDWESLCLISTARCARVSYSAYDGTSDCKVDAMLGLKLMNSGHMSPFEHPARAYESGARRRIKNFTGWVQYRAYIPREHDRLKPFEVVDGGSPFEETAARL